MAQLKKNLKPFLVQKTKPGELFTSRPIDVTLSMRDMDTDLLL